MIGKQTYSVMTPITRLPWLVAGAGTLCASVAFLVISHVPEAEPNFGLLPISWVVVIGVLAGGMFLSLFQARDHSMPPIWVVVGVGLIARIILLGSEPLWEIDYYRYLWDGGMLANGLNPYTWSPRDVLGGHAPESVSVLGTQGQIILGQINYPDLRTIYPPVAQAIFAVAHLIDPWSISAWRGVLLVFDGLGLILLAMVLRQMGISCHWIALYWWNPLVIQMTINAAHMDVLLLPFVLAAVLFALQGREMRCVVVLGIAAGIKLWPAILVLPLVVHATGEWKKRVVALVVFIGVCCLVMAPLVLSGLGENSGLTAYAQTWTTNSAVFGVLESLNRSLLSELGMYQFNAGTITRAFCALLLLGVVITRLRHCALDSGRLCRSLLIIVTAMFILSPATYPWYFCWLAPFMAIVPNQSVALWTATLPLYHLRFHPWFLDNPGTFDSVVVWLEHGPVIGLLILSFAFSRLGSRS